ncbi:MAG: signal peptidase I [Verrucomicrobiota bacterium]
MNFFERRRYRKVVERLLQEARHARHMREDVASAQQLDELAKAEAGVRSAWVLRNRPALDGALERLVASVSAVYPVRAHAWLREHVEILVVALSVAMAFRTYFIQPFKIPTGSMQPTLYGITAQTQPQRGVGDIFPLNLVSLALFGERYIEVKALLSGKVDSRYAIDEDSKLLIYFVAGVPHRVYRGFNVYFSPGDYVVKGQLMASGRVRIGDHIFVDKVRYNFSKPKRGDIIVFSTDTITYPRIRPNSFYIKRLAALPGEEVSINPPYLIIDGQPITTPYPFERLLNERGRGYMGYTLPHKQQDAPVFLAEAWDVRRLGPAQYLPLGDNTAFSYDGRYFGPVTQDALVGPAFFVYWPISDRWGIVR